MLIIATGGAFQISAYSACKAGGVMPQVEPNLKTLNAADLRRQLDELLRQIAKGTTRAVIEEDGVAVAALVSAEDLRRLQRDEDFEALEDYARGFESIPIAELEQEIANALREVRAERRKEREQHHASGA
jgi:prevent-host-death family protein